MVRRPNCDDLSAEMGLSMYGPYCDEMLGRGQEEGIIDTSSAEQEKLNFE